MRKLPKIFRLILPISAIALALPGLTSVAQAQQGADEEIAQHDPFVQRTANCYWRCRDVGTSGDNAWPAT